MASDRRLGTTPKQRRVDRCDNVEVVRTALGGSESLPTDFEPENVNDGEESDEGREEEEEEERAQKRKVKIVKRSCIVGESYFEREKAAPESQIDRTQVCPGPHRPWLVPAAGGGSREEGKAGRGQRAPPQRPRGVCRR